MLKPQSARFTLFIAALVGLPPLAIDMSLPGLSAITAGLGVDAGLGSLTLTSFLAGFGLSQLLFGPLSDRFGRRPVLIGGLLFYLFGGLACAVAPTFPLLLIARVIQGFGGAAGTVLALAMIRDCFEGGAARRRLAYINAVMNVAPVIAPVFGAGMLAVASWRGIYAVLSVVGGLVWLSSVAFVPETIRRHDPSAIRPGVLLRSYLRVLTHRRSLAHSLIGGMLFANMFSFISGSPLVFIDQLGLSRAAFSGIFAMTSGGLVFGALAAGRLAHAPFSRLFLQYGSAVMLIASLGLLGMAISGRFSVVASMVFLLLNYAAVGFAIPMSVHGAMEPFAEIAGVASAVNGALRMLGGALAGAVVTLLYRGTPVAMTASMALFAAVALGLWACLLRTRQPVVAAAGE